MPRTSTKNWTIQEVLDEATQLLGEGVQWLSGKDPDYPLTKSTGAESTSYMLAGQMVEVFVSAACKVAKEAREASDTKKLKGVTEKNLKQLIVNEVINNPDIRAAVEQGLIERSRAS